MAAKKATKKATKKSAKKVAKKVAKKASSKSGSLETRIRDLLPKSAVKVLEVLANAVVVSKNGKIVSDDAAAQRLGAGVFPTDAAQAKAFAGLLKKAVKELDAELAKRTTISPFF